MVGLATVAAWPGIAVLLLHSILGAWLGHEPYVDPVMHFSGGGAAAYFFWRGGLIAARQIGTPTRLGLDLFALGLTCMVAVFWEFAEYFVNVNFGSRMERGLGNSLRDLAIGVTGALTYIGVNRLRGRS